MHETAGVCVCVLRSHFSHLHVVWCFGVCLCCTSLPSQVSRAAWDSSTRKWLLEGMLRFPTRTQTDAKQQPPHKPWNLGVFDGLVLADKMTGCTGEMDLVMHLQCTCNVLVLYLCCTCDVFVGIEWALCGLVLSCTHHAGTPGFVELSGTPAGAKLQAAMAQVGSKPLLVLMAAWQPPELPLEEQTEGDAAEQQAGGGGGGLEAARRPPPVVPLPFDAAAVSGSDEIQWISLDSTKPVRMLPAPVVIHMLGLCRSASAQATMPWCCYWLWLQPRPSAPFF